MTFFRRTAHMAESIVTLAELRLYSNAACNKERIDDVPARFEQIFANCGKIRKKK